MFILIPHLSWSSLWMAFLCISGVGVAGSGLEPEAIAYATKKQRWANDNRGTEKLINRKKKYNAMAKNDKRQKIVHWKTT